MLCIILLFYDAVSTDGSLDVDVQYVIMIYELVRMNQQSIMAYFMALSCNSLEGTLPFPEYKDGKFFCFSGFPQVFNRLNFSHLFRPSGHLS